jgi:hypothetical protein
MASRAAAGISRRSQASHTSSDASCVDSRGSGWNTPLRCAIPAEIERAVLPEPRSTAGSASPICPEASPRFFVSPRPLPRSSSALERTTKRMKRYLRRRRLLEEGGDDREERDGLAELVRGSRGAAWKEVEVRLNDGKTRKIVCDDRRRPPPRSPPPCAGRVRDVRPSAGRGAGTRDSLRRRGARGSLPRTE